MSAGDPKQWPNAAISTKWLVYDPEDGWTERDTRDEAEAEFGRAVDYRRDEASECWHESADSIAWGVWIPIERLKLVATAWPDDDSEEGERCRDAGWDAMLDGVVERVEPDQAARDWMGTPPPADHALLAAGNRMLHEQIQAASSALQVMAGLETPNPDLPIETAIGIVRRFHEALIRERTEQRGVLRAQLADMTAERDALRAELLKPVAGPWRNTDHGRWRLSISGFWALKWSADGWSVWTENHTCMAHGPETGPEAEALADAAAAPYWRLTPTPESTP